MNPATIKLIAIAVCFVLAAAGGWTARGWKADSDQLDAVQEEAKRHARNTEALAEGLQQIALVRELERQQAATDRTTFQRRLQDARKNTSLVQCQPAAVDGQPAAHDPALRFTPGFIRLWNEALDIGLPAALRAGGTESADSWADLPDAEAVLANLAANAEACNELRARARICKSYIERIEALE